MKLLRQIFLLLLLACLALPGAYALDLRVGLVSYWPLDTADNGLTPDLAFGNNLTIPNGSTQVTGVLSNAFTFDGTSKYLVANHTPDNRVNGLPVYAAGSYTVAMWVKGAPGQNGHYLFTEGSTTNNNPLFILQTANTATGVFTNKLDVIIRSTSGTALINHVKSTNVVFDNTWHHIAWVDTNGAVSLYVDGNLDPANFNYVAQPASAFALNTTALGALVRASVSGYFAGSLDDVGVWERALSQAEVRSLMTNSIPQPITPQPPFLTRTFGASTNSLGDYVILPGTAIGYRPLTYQWYWGGQALADQTNNSLVLNSLTNTTNSTVSLVVSNPQGAVTNGPWTFVVAPDAAPNLSAGLVSYWPLDLVNETAVTTNSPDLYSADNFLLNGPDTNSLLAGEFGNALAFNGAGQYASRVGGVPIFSATNYSLAFWVNGSPQVSERVFAEASTANNNPLFTLGTDVSSASGSLDLFIRNDAGVVQVNNLASTTPVFDGTWHHVVWVDQNGRALLYVDGVLDATAYAYTRSGTYTLNSTALGGIVRAAPGNFFTGDIDEVAVWTRRLSYTEIQNLQTGTLPPPKQLLPPAIVSLSSVPPDLTNGVYVGDTVTFTVQATGSNPLNYQWLKNGLAISAAANPSATSNALVLSNVSASAVGTYSVVITNGGFGLVGGSVTGSVTLAAVQNYTPLTNGLVLAVDFGLTGTPDAQPGFQVFNLGINGTTYSNAVGVTVAPVGGIVLAERDRGAVTINNPPAFTQASHYNKFLFGGVATDGTGLTVQISHLAPNTSFGLTVWSWDVSSTGSRVADWTEISSGTPIPISTGYTFNGSVAPVADYDDTFGALLTSSPGGQLVLQGLRDGGTSFGVFVNAIQLVANPVIQIVSTSIAPDGNLQLVVQAQYPGQTISFLESPDLSPGSFQPATDATITATHGPLVTAEFPFASTQLFYRAVGQ